MKFSYNWLKELVNFRQSPQELSDLINLHITEIESLSAQVAAYSGVIVAEILEIELHPNASKLQLVILDIGRGRRAKVVCGAANIRVGQKVPLATVGAQLPGGEVKKVVIRGIESGGMICSSAELGLGQASQGILILPAGAPIGRPVHEAAAAREDVIFDLKVLSNRPDYLSYIGIAREIAAVLNQDWSVPLDLKYRESAQVKTADQIKVKIEDQQQCPYYLARWVGKVEVKESPQWLKDKLSSSDIRPINNLVDISNLVMLELGQPVHIFDAAKVKQKQIIVRRAKTKELITTLDDQEHQLSRSVLLIADNQGPIAVAGIMGGRDSAVSDLTEAVVIEVATFDPLTIRRGSKSIGLVTDASLRFERGLSPYLAKLAMARVLHLVQSLSPDVVIAKGAVAVGSSSLRPASINLQIQDVTALLGASITSARMVSILRRLGFSISKSGKSFKVTPPPFRADIKEIADLVEEVVRIWGIDKVAPQIPTVAMVPPAISQRYRAIENLKDYLARSGFSETPSHCFIGQDWANKLGLKLNSELKLMNPLSSNWTHLSSQLWPNLLWFVSRADEKDIKIFEINTVFDPPAQGVLPTETKSLSVVAYIDGSETYRLVRGLIEAVVSLAAGVKLTPIPSGADDKFINVLRVMVDKQVIGSIEEISPRLADQLGIPRATVWAELNLDQLFGAQVQDAPKFRPFSQYPSSQFDLAVELPATVSAGDLISDIRGSSMIVHNVEVFDVYKQSDHRRSIGLRVVLQADDRTLTEGEIKTTESKIINLVTTKYRGKIRGSGS